MYMVAALDAGDVIRTVSTEIGEHEDAAALTLRLSELGAQALERDDPDACGRHGEAHTAGRVGIHLCAHARPLAFAHRLDEERTGDRLPGARSHSVALCRDERGRKSVKVYETVSGEMTADAPGTMHAVKRGLSCRLRRRQEPHHHTASGGGRQAHGGCRLSARSPAQNKRLKGESLCLTILTATVTILANLVYLPFLLVLVLLLSLYAQAAVSGNFSRYSKVTNRRGLTRRRRRLVCCAHGI